MSTHHLLKDILNYQQCKSAKQRACIRKLQAETTILIGYQTAPGKNGSSLREIYRNFFTDPNSQMGFQNGQNETVFFVCSCVFTAHSPLNKSRSFLLVCWPLITPSPETELTWSFGSVFSSFSIN